MNVKSISDLNKKYDLELEKVVNNIKKSKAKLVLLQFPDGLKPYAVSVVDFLEDKCKNVDFLISMDSCFGACDVPEVGELKIDLVFQFGHNKILPSYA